MEERHDDAHCPLVDSRLTLTTARMRTCGTRALRPCAGSHGIRPDAAHQHGASQVFADYPASSSFRRA